MFESFKELRSLNLSYSGMGGLINEKGSDGLKKLEILDLSHNYLNNSILLSMTTLPSLTTLILNGNNMRGSFPSKGFERLEVLDLGYSSFSSSNLSTLGTTLSSLKQLILSGNYMEGSFPIQEFSKLKNLEVLDVSWNSFNNTIPIQGKLHITFLLQCWNGIIAYIYMYIHSAKIQSSTDSIKFFKFSKLKYLDMSQNNFNADILSFSSKFSSVEILDLSSNNLEGPLPDQDLFQLKNLTVLSFNGNRLNGSLPIRGLCSLTKLQELDLSHNDFGGSLLPCLQNFTSLRFLDLSGNQFTGHIPSSWLASLHSLKFIDLSFNLFEGQFSFNAFADNSNLDVVKFASDNNQFEVVSKYPGWIPSFQLKVLVLQNCALDSIPEFLFHQFKLKAIDFANNKIKGSFPMWLLENNTELDILTLRNNSFKGQIHMPTYTNFNITEFDVSDNQFVGQLQDIGGQIFPNMKFLNLSKNGFQGDFRFSPGYNCKLISLDLSFNNFSGDVPEPLISSCTSLEVLRLSSNNFHGQIFTARFKLTSLNILQLNDNQFEGTLSSLVFQIPTLYMLDLSNNSFHGEIPLWTNHMVQASYVDLSQNHFKGQISCEILLAGSHVDLSHNYLSGSLPSCFNVQHILYLGGPLHVNLQGNRLTGAIPEAFLNSSYLLTLNLRDNELSGSLPNKFVTFPNLRVLLLGGNHLNGSIPSGLCQLNKISLLDLSRNYFSGSIPHCLYNLSFGNNNWPNDQFSLPTGLWTETDNVYSESLLHMEEYSIGYDIRTFKVEEVEFVTKHMKYAFKGDILNYLFGLDLSDNNLEGQIPYQLGKLSQLRALNLSHNCLTGSIPASLSNLTQLESFDLSHNKLSGQIPSQLIALHFLAVFSVAYNNLSGKIPDMKGQFSTFDNTSYEGNPFLCGALLEKNCSSDNEPSASLGHKADGKWYEVDEVVFFSSFCGSFIMFFLGVIIVLYVNPYWRQKLCYPMEEFMFSCYYFLYDILF
ncbi:receptor-like protein 13 isoform X1 [Manihot esculenta]|uniref:receptor-like protein 13 isoform X1 n=1 Tax=Manihot esculenta TaxID=3983 RepID=UPI001CC41E49|nr:receptor-like protein 13 isoform X1 [Manihot esculenta]